MHHTFGMDVLKLGSWSSLQGSTVSELHMHSQDCHVIVCPAEKFTPHVRAPQDSHVIVYSTCACPAGQSRARDMHSRQTIT